ncbi:hypothetical protein ERJ75_000239500 [Trypanosoma vivax]|uniref:Uncharacterized protein n=1 Tax=Trypanosoma vivax (strain Y486) TaxID=1055687 RepID=G0TY41_TRYVY|nr:hypothetical protein TRVL_00822 [Trypanosoma vivax]KAH8618686.1 hypothetical protein ERJ75_000239500 [Trypanosoma vivax]CCC48886.1 conserved hypothetical protein [Trypanosoma vivax Y486]
MFKKRVEPKDKPSAPNEQRQKPATTNAPKQKSATPEESRQSASSKGAPTSVVPNDNKTVAQSIVNLKTRLMTPFMLYDETKHQVVLNTAHDRILRSEVTRIQGVVLRGIRQALDQDSRTTPKEALYCLQKSVMLAFASCAVTSDTEALVPCCTEEAAAPLLPRLEAIFAARNACPKCILSLAAVLSTGSVLDNLVEVCKRIGARLTAEGTAPIASRRTEKEKQALEATKKNVQDFKQLRATMAATFDSISIPSKKATGLPPSPSSSATDIKAAEMIIQLYYSLLNWMLMIQPERVNLSTPRHVGDAPGSPQGSESLFARVTFYDAASGKVVIERSSLTSKWGVMVNPQGTMIGVENALRVATGAGGELYYALQLQSSGLPIFDVNGVRVRESDEMDGGKESSEAKTKRLEKIRAALMGPNTVVSFKVAPIIGLREPREITFNLVQQGGEGASGQLADLILRRMSVDVDWNIKFSPGDKKQLVLESIPETLQLSDSAREFVERNSGSLVVVQVNGCDTVKNKFIVDLVNSSLILVLRLQVLPRRQDNVKNVSADNDGAHLSKPKVAVVDTVASNLSSKSVAEVRATEAPDTVQEISTEAQVLEDDDEEVWTSRSTNDKPQVSNNTKVASTLVGGGAANDDSPVDSSSGVVVELAHDEEIEVAKHRELLQKHDIDPDKPLPESQVAPVAQETRKRGRPRKALDSTAASSGRTAAGRGTDDVTDETTMSAEATEDDVTEGSSKRGRPRKKKDDKTLQKKDVKKQLSSNVNDGETRDQKVKPEKSAEGSVGRKPGEGKAPEKSAPVKKGQAGSDSARNDSAERKEEDGSDVEDVKKNSAERDSTLVEAAEAQKVMDKPLVQVKSQSDAAAEVIKRKESERRATASPSESVKPSKTVGAAASAEKAKVVEQPHVSPAVLENAPPLTFENAVTLDRFDGTNMELRRPDSSTPWDIRLLLGGDKLTLTRLPPTSAALKNHPFIKKLLPDASGHINWQVESVNGIELGSANKGARAKAMEVIKKANKVTFVLRSLLK